MTWWTFGSVPELEGKEILRLVEEEPEKIQIVDVRTEGEYEGGHIKGARSCSLFPPWSFQNRLEQMQLDKEKLIIAICLSAHRSITAQKMLTKMGFESKQLKGGMKAWRKEKLPEVSGKEPYGDTKSENEEESKEG